MFDSIQVTGSQSLGTGIRKDVPKRLFITLNNDETITIEGTDACREALLEIHNSQKLLKMLSENN